MTSQAAQDLEDDEHATNLEKLTLTIASGREHQFIKETSRELLGHTSRAEEVC